MWVLHLISATLAMVAVLFTFLVGRALWGELVGGLAATSLAVCPLFFAQAGLLQLDLAATTFSMIALYALIRGRWFLYFGSASLMLLSKETSVLLIPAMAGFAWMRTDGLPQSDRLRVLAFSTLPVFTFFVSCLSHKLLTGYRRAD
jgi:predicted membrane-bound dolichyl-phosphate-mannose-protein mannosyltransferase